MKNKRKIFIVALAAIMFLAIVSTVVLGATYARFVTTISDSATSQVAGFYISGGVTNQEEILESEQVALLAPGETVEVELQISYFAQVNTQITMTSNSPISGTGAFANFDALVSEFVEEYPTYDTDLLPASLGEMFSVKISNSADLASAIANSIRTSGGLGGYADYVEAMPASATSSIVVTIPVIIKWESTNGASDLWDTFVGNKIATLIINSDVKSLVSVDLGLKVEQVTNYTITLASSSWNFNSQINTDALSSGKTYNINFTSGGNSYVGLKKGSLIFIDANSVETVAYNGSTWASEDYKTIEITGGTDATLAELITWVNANATRAAQQAEPTPATPQDPEPAAQTYLISFVNLNGASLQSSNVNEGSTPVYSGATPMLIGFDNEDEEMPIAISFVFAGWKNGASEYAASSALPEVSGAATYTAMYDVYLNGNLLEDAVITCEVDGDSVITMIEYTNENDSPESVTQILTTDGNETVEQILYSDENGDEYSWPE